MSGSEEPNEGAGKLRRIHLESRLREVEDQLRHEMRARGFDPEQSDNLALTAPLAKLSAERENLRAELEALTEGFHDRN